MADATVFLRYVEEVARSLVRHGARRLVFLNTSISRAAGLPLAIVARDLREQGTPDPGRLLGRPRDPELRALEEQPRGGHADEIETSIHLVLQPQLVHWKRRWPISGSPPKDYPGYQPGLFSRDPNDPAFSTTGVFGDPTKATAEKGRKALAILTAQWLKALTGFAQAPLPKAK